MCNLLGLNVRYTNTLTDKPNDKYFFCRQLFILIFYVNMFKHIQFEFTETRHLTKRIFLMQTIDKSSQYICLAKESTWCDMMQTLSASQHQQNHNSCKLKFYCEWWINNWLCGIYLLWYVVCGWRDFTEKFHALFCVWSLPSK